MASLPNFPAIRPSLLLDFASSRRLDPRVSLVRTTTGTIINAAGQLEVMPANTPRIDFDPVTGRCLGLQVEEQRTNLLTHPNNFTDASWTKIRASVTPANDGWYRLTEDASPAASHTVAKLVAAASSTTYTWSVDVKAGERKFARVEWGTFANQEAPFSLLINLETGVVSNGVAGRFTIAKLNEGWRVSITTTTKAGISSGISATVYPCSSTGAATYDGDGVSGIYFRYGQAEVGASPTSYIPGTTAQVTRAADLCTFPDFSWSDWSRGISIFAEYQVPQNLPADATLVAFSNGAAQVEQIDMRFVASGVATRTRTGSVTKASTIHTNVLPGQIGRTAISVKNGGFVSATNGSVYEVAAEFIPGALLDRISLGYRAINNNPLNSHLLKVAVYPSALTAAQLQRLTA